VLAQPGLGQPQGREVRVRAVDLDWQAEGDRGRARVLLDDLDFQAIRLAALRRGDARQAGAAGQAGQAGLQLGVISSLTSPEMPTCSAPCA
jgi:hypothetical protein